MAAVEVSGLWRGRGLTSERVMAAVLGGSHRWSKVFGEPMDPQTRIAAVEVDRNGCVLVTYELLSEWLTQLGYVEVD